MNCREQEEEKILVLCRKNLSKSAARDVFVLTYDRMRRYEGGWHKEKKLLFPSYIFLNSENGELLADEIQSLLPYTSADREDSRIVAYSIGKSNGLIRMNEDEESFLRFLYGNHYHLEMSTGIIRDGILRIITGPLKGMEGRICKIDRHKRLAKLVTAPKGTNSGSRHENHRLESQAVSDPDFGYIMAGLEITEKRG